MKITKPNITEFLGASVLTILEVQLFDSFDWFQKIIAFIPETYITLFENFITIAVLITFNTAILRLLIEGIHWLGNKFPVVAKAIDFLQKSRSIMWVSIVLTIGVFSLVITQISYKFKSSDNTIPSVVAYKPQISIVRSNQYETPLVYRICFDDETGIQKVFFDESYIVLNGCTANLTVYPYDEYSYILSICNIEGSAGQHHISIKAGAVMDVGGNYSKEIALGSFFLYSDESEVDLVAPQIELKRLESTEPNTLIFEVQITDNRALSSVRLMPEHIVLKGFTADVEVDFANAGNRKLILRNISGHSVNEPCNIIISSGVAVDEWKNKSEYYISEDFYIS